MLFYSIIMHLLPVSKCHVTCMMSTIEFQTIQQKAVIPITLKGKRCIE